MSLSSGYLDPTHEQSAVPLSRQFTEQPPIPEWIIFPQCTRSVAINKAVGNCTWHPGVVPFHEPGVPAANPKIVTSGCESCHDSSINTGRSGNSAHHAQSRLRPRNYQPTECSSLNALTNRSSIVLKSPCEIAFKEI